MPFRVRLVAEQIGDRQLLLHAEGSQVDHLLPHRSDVVPHGRENVALLLKAFVDSVGAPGNRLKALIDDFIRPSSDSIRSSSD